MLKFLATEVDGTVSVHQIKHGRPHPLGSFKRSRANMNADIRQVTNIFLSSLKHIPTNWSLADGSINERMYDNKYTILTSTEQL